MERYDLPDFHVRGLRFARLQSGGEAFLEHLSNFGRLCLGSWSHHVQAFTPAVSLTLLQPDFHYQFTKSRVPDLTIMERTNIIRIISDDLLKLKSDSSASVWVFEILNSESNLESIRPGPDRGPPVHHYTAATSVPVIGITAMYDQWLKCHRTQGNAVTHLQFLV